MTTVRNAMARQIRLAMDAGESTYLRQPSMGWRSWYGLPILLPVLHTMLAWLSRPSGILTGQDDARYLLLAQSLGQLQYRDLMWPDSPLHHMYPPGYPALVALWSAFGGDRFEWLVLLGVALSAGTMVMVFLSMRRVFSAGAVMASMLVLAVNPELIFWSSQIRPETALAFCLMLLVFGATCLPGSSRREYLMLGAALAAPLLRTAAVGVPVALVLYHLSARRFNAAARAALATALVVGPLLYWTLTDTSMVVGSSYAADFSVAGGSNESMLGVLFQRVLASVRYYATQGLPWILPAPTIKGTIVDNVLIVLILTVALMAGLAVTARRQPVAVYVLGMSVAPLIVWRFALGRFIVPQLVLLVPMLVVGLMAAGARFGRRTSIALVSLFVIAVAGAGFHRTAGTLRTAISCERGGTYPDAKCVSMEEAAFFEALRFIEDSVPKRDIILSAKSETISYYSGRITFPLAVIANSDSAVFWNTLEHHRIAHVLLSALQFNERRRLAPLLTKRCNDLTLMAAFEPHTYLFRLKARRPDVPDADVSVRDRSPARNACDALASYLTIPEPT